MKPDGTTGLSSSNTGVDMIYDQESGDTHAGEIPGGTLGAIHHLLNQTSAVLSIQAVTASIFIEYSLTNIAHIEFCI